VAQGTTNSYGVMSWHGLEPGTYEIDEVGTKWWYASADRADSDGNLVVVAGKENDRPGLQLRTEGRDQETAEVPEHRH
jgi:hypothetical protein